jgi:SAM-dependent methyltransferase
MTRLDSIPGLGSNVNVEAEEVEPAETPDVDLGEAFALGAIHYRAFVGPPEDYDLVSAMTFGLLTALGLRQHHALLDIGCGSLRVGRLLIPYLNRGRYTGFEPNRWLVEEGIAKECGSEQVAIKHPHFLFTEDPREIEASARFDFALAQSIFSHAGLDLISIWLEVLSEHLEHDGALVATFIEGEEDHAAPGWVYPECVAYRPSTLARAASEHGFRFRTLDWNHPRQTWCLFSKPDFPLEWLDQNPLSWNASLAAGRWR